MKIFEFFKKDKPIVEVQYPYFTYTAYTEQRVTVKFKNGDVRIFTGQNSTDVRCTTEELINTYVDPVVYPGYDQKYTTLIIQKFEGKKVIFCDNIESYDLEKPITEYKRV